MGMKHPLMKVRPISQASRQTKQKAKKCASKDDNFLAWKTCLSNREFCFFGCSLLAEIFNSASVWLHHPFCKCNWSCFCLQCSWSRTASDRRRRRPWRAAWWPELWASSHPRPASSETRSDENSGRPKVGQAEAESNEPVKRSDFCRTAQKCKDTQLLLLVRTSCAIFTLGAWHHDAEHYTQPENRCELRLGKGMIIWRHPVLWFQRSGAENDSNRRMPGMAVSENVRWTCEHLKNTDLLHQGRSNLFGTPRSRGQCPKPF